MYMVCQQPSAHKHLCRILSARIMPLRTCLVRSIAVVVCSTVFAAPAAAQEQPAAAATPAWSWMADGSLFATFNDQRSARGESQFRSQNWLMAMATRAAGKGQLTLSGMFSLDPVTVTKRGYSELFQMGEAYQKLENIDRQHPHDLFSQLAVGWRVPMGKASAFTITGAPVGEATLGPVAFMHRLSASENPTAPLAHHTLDSTHISQGVIAAAVDLGPVTLEGSAFHGREPDEKRYGITPGALDSWATRLWYRPSNAWIAQVSYGFLHQPEELEPGNIKRTTGSLTWTRERVDHAFSITGALGHNTRTYTKLSAFLLEALARKGRTSAYTRIELLHVETEHLLFPTVVHRPHPGELIDPLNAYTVGAVRDLPSARWFSVGLGGDVTFYNVPVRLRPFYGDRPVAIHIFARVRPHGGRFMRMWNMTMTEPMRHSGVSMP